MKRPAQLSGRTLIGERQLAEKVARMAEAVARDTPEGSVLSVVVPLDGAFLFAADLVRRLPVPVRLALVPVRSVARGGDPARLALPPGFPVEGADVLVVEDILDTGRTLSAMRDALGRLRPGRVRIAVLLDKPSRREVQVRPDYVGFTIPNLWVVGYGLDSEGLYRNLPYVTWIE